MASKAALVYGSAGALGRSIVSTLKNAAFDVFGVDFVKNDDCAHNYILTGKDFEADVTGVVSNLSSKGLTFDAVICAAGGWSGGSFNSETSSLLKSVNQLWNMNVQSAVATGHIGAKFAKKGGLVVFTGADVARSGTSGMVGYGLTKAATHHMAQSLASELKNDGTTVVTILPITLDTPSNRSGMPNADFSSWTPVSTIAEKIHSYMDASSRPDTGSLIRAVTKDNVTSWENVHTEY